MNQKQIADRLRVLADAPTLSIENRGELDDIANEIDPPSDPGTVVWWRRKPDDRWRLGYISDGQYGVVPLQGGDRGFDDYYIPWGNFSDYKPARILGPDEVAVKVPELGEWRRGADRADLFWQFMTLGYPMPSMEYSGVSVTHKEAERMKASE